MATAQSESNELKRIGATPIHNSGRGFHKGDGILDDFLVDVKEYVKSYGLSKSSWGKVCSDAIHEGKAPLLHIVLGEGNEKVRLWVMEASMGQELLDYKFRYESVSE